MRPQQRTGQADDQLIAISSAIPDRLELTGGRGPDAIAGLVVTRAGEHAWAAINQQLTEGHGALFWIGGPAGTGKTHFLSYVLALDSRAGGLSARPGRRLTLVLAAPVLSDAEQFERDAVDLIRHALGGNDGTVGVLSRQLRGGDALRVVLDQAKRHGVRTITVAIDCGDTDPVETISCFEMLAGLAATVRNPQLIVLIAARGNISCPGGKAFTVEAAPDEAAVVAIQRARRLGEAAMPIAAAAYAGLEIANYRPHQIYPFHPQTVALLLSLGDPLRLIPTVARAARDALVAWHVEAPPRGLIWPAELMRTAAETLENRLGQSGNAALARAHTAAAALGGGRDTIAHEILDLIALNHAANSGGPVHLDTLSAQLMPHGNLAQVVPGDVLANVAEELAIRSPGVILYEPETDVVRFNPRAADLPEIAAYNNALPLIRRFDSASQVTEPEELHAALERLRLALAAALERATHYRETLMRAAQETGFPLGPGHERIFVEYLAIVSAGPQGLLSIAGDAQRAEACAHTLAEYELLAAMAAAVPRIRAMREYLLGMGLHEEFKDDPQIDAATARIETDCRLLVTAVNGALLAKSAATLDALESRFQRFKWTYVPYYRAAHESWRQEMERAAMLAEDGERQLAVLRRLNAIPALGLPQGADLAPLFAGVTTRVVRCQLDEPLAPEVIPRCSCCNYVVGTPSPCEELADLLTRIRRAIEGKLAILSQGAIERLIRQHDHSHRLDGFIKITQAAQTAALVRVLDDKLAHYLSRLLEESPAADAPNQQPSPALRTVGSSKRRPEKLPRGGRRN